MCNLEVWGSFFPKKKKRAHTYRGETEKMLDAFEFLVPFVPKIIQFVYQHMISQNPF